MDEGYTLKCGNYTCKNKYETKSIKGLEHFNQDDCPRFCCKNCMLIRKEYEEMKKYHIKPTDHTSF